MPGVDLEASIQNYSILKKFLVFYLTQAPKIVGRVTTLGLQ
jgi:hypothetical protein